jgi:hypothetical protein
MLDPVGTRDILPPYLKWVEEEGHHSGTWDVLDVNPAD